MHPLFIILQICTGILQISGALFPYCFQCWGTLSNNFQPPQRALSLICFLIATVSAHWTPPCPAVRMYLYGKTRAVTELTIVTFLAEFPLLHGLAIQCSKTTISYISSSFLFVFDGRINIISRIMITSEGKKVSFTQ